MRNQLTALGRQPPQHCDHHQPPADLQLDPRQLASTRLVVRVPELHNAFGATNEPSSERKRRDGLQLDEEPIAELQRQRGSPGQILEALPKRKMQKMIGKGGGT